MLKKNELRDRLSAIRKAFDKQTKEREQTLQKAVSSISLSQRTQCSKNTSQKSSQAIQSLTDFFTTTSPNSSVYISLLAVDGNAKTLQSVLAQARKLDKAAYLFSIDPETEGGKGKVVHANYLPEAFRKDEFNAKVWANAVSEVLGGKVCGYACLSVSIH